MMPLPDRIFAEMYRSKRESEIDRYIREECHGQMPLLSTRTERRNLLRHRLFRKKPV